MALTVSFYSVFNKRKNSTKQPAPGSYSYKSDINCLLKEPTSVKNPVLIVAGADYNLDYAYIAAWNKYYYIDDIISISNTEAEYHLSEDVLASNKAYITSSSQKCMIAYASMGWDARQIDPRIPTKVTKGRALVSSGPLFSGEWYIVEVINNSAIHDTAGFTRAYLLNAKALNKLRQWFADASVIQQISNYFNGTPLQGVVNCRWIPYTPNTIAYANPIDKMYIGSIFPTQSAYLFNMTTELCYEIPGNQSMYANVALTIPYHYADYRQFEPYTTALLFLPGVGNVGITLADFQNSKINVYTAVEINTGIVTYHLMTDTNEIVQTFVANLSVQCAIAQNTNNGGGVIQSITQAIGGAAALVVGAYTGNVAAAAGGAVSALAGATNTILNSGQHSPSVMGSNGGRGVALRLDILLSVFWQNTEDPDAADWIAEKGRPVNKVMAMNTFTSGYVQTIDAHIKMAGTVDDRLEVESYLNNGIFIE